MKYGMGKGSVYLCNFCGASSRNGTPMLISRLDGESCICESCAYGVAIGTEPVRVLHKGAAVPEPVACAPRASAIDSLLPPGSWLRRLVDAL
jgi:hypothetical protein